MASVRINFHENGPGGWRPNEDTDTHRDRMVVADSIFTSIRMKQPERNSP
jgi:hypothetical protein